MAIAKQLPGTRFIAFVAVTGLATLAAGSLQAQGKKYRDLELYGIGSYSHVSEKTTSFFGPSRTTAAGGGFFGGGVGARIGLFGLQAEFLQSRTSGSAQPSSLNTGVLNFVIEKKSGRIRPGGIVFGVGGASGPESSSLFLQAGAGVAFMLTDKLYIRPQIRYQDWERLFGDRRSAISVAVAVGFRLPVFD
jgi:hypothetical protein